MNRCRVLALACVFAVAACTPAATPDVVGSSTAGAILGGSADTTRDAVMALLQMETSTTAFACSGTTIANVGTSAFLLTAAHCVFKHDANHALVLPLTAAGPAVMTVVPGPDWQTSLAQGRKYSVTAISVAAGYDGASDSANDLAVVRYVTTGASVPVIPIVEPADDALAVGSLLTLVGYGETTPGTQNSMRRTVDRSIERLTPQHLIYPQNDMKGSCAGDSGGPALANVAGSQRVAGVISYSLSIPSLGLVCTLEGAAVRVSSHATFIRGVIGPAPTPDAGVPPDAATSMDAARDGSDGAPPQQCGKVTDPRPECAACIASRCCSVAAVCGADPLCLSCGANPLPSCAPYPPSATLTACLATCPGNPCGVPLDAGTGQAEAGADAGPPDGRAPDGSAPDATGTDGAPAGDGGDAAPSAPDAGATLDAAAVSDARPMDTRPTDATASDAGADRAGDAAGAPAESSGCGCDTGQRSQPVLPGVLLLVVASCAARRRLRAASRSRCGSWPTDRDRASCRPD
jgi:hypothetical protein